MVDNICKYPWNKYKHSKHARDYRINSEETVFLWRLAYKSRKVCRLYIEELLCSFWQVIILIIKRNHGGFFSLENVFTSQQHDHPLRNDLELWKVQLLFTLEMIILGMRDSLLTSSNTTQWPAFRAASKGPSRQANSPPLPPSTGRSAPNRSVISFERGRSEEKPKLHKKLTRSQDSKSKMINTCVLCHFSFSRKN